jgi:hypothetical protein
VFVASVDVPYDKIAPPRIAGNFLNPIVHS